MMFMRLFLSLAVLIPLVFACGEKVFTENVNCSECFTPEPDSVYLYVDLTINDEYTEIPLVIYRGDVENDQIDYIDTAYSTPYVLAVAIDQEYSVKAKYRKKDQTLFAIDGTRIKTLLVTATCDQDCYIIRNDRVNVEIRDKFLDF
jgi:hypothetical protein